MLAGKKGQDQIDDAWLRGHDGPEQMERHWQWAMGIPAQHGTSWHIMAHEDRRRGGGMGSVDIGDDGEATRRVAPRSPSPSRFTSRLHHLDARMSTFLSLFTTHTLYFFVFFYFAQPAHPVSFLPSLPFLACLPVWTFVIPSFALLPSHPACPSPIASSTPTVRPRVNQLGLCRPRGFPRR